MKYSISAFTNKGTKRKINQDRILVQETILEDSFCNYIEQDTCRCFVADGIGGGPSGELAAQFVLDNILRLIETNAYHTNDELKNILREINLDLLQLGNSNSSYLGSGTTLVGILANEKKFKIINVGDSLAYVYRNETMIKITDDQILDPFVENSPITSYFGGRRYEMNPVFNTVLRELLPNDKIIVASDGLLKSITIKHLKSILSNSKSIFDKSIFIMEKCLEVGAEDNISVIIIDVIADKL